MDCHKFVYILRLGLSPYQFKGLGTVGHLCRHYIVAGRELADIECDFVRFAQDNRSGHSNSTHRIYGYIIYCGG